MIWFASWFVAIELLGLGILPLAVRVFRSLPDRGYLFAKPLGILVVAYLCWLLGMFGVLRFQQVTIVVVLVLVAAVSWATWGRETLAHLRSAGSSVWTSELLFLAAFAAAALVRAYNPEISGTEKPMDLAFLNAIQRTETFPPEDPWMSGHSISYYYFGYLLLAMVAKLSGVPPSVGYNLGVALVYALLLAGSYSIAFNLLAALRPRLTLWRRSLAALLAPVMVGVMGNLVIGFEVLAARGVGDSSFWGLVGIKGLQASAQPEGWLPTSHWWWWRASRVIPTTKPDGINEFPFFSFLLGDLHPHYTALPWVLLVIGLALAAALSTEDSGLSGGPQASSSRPALALLGVVVPALCLGFLLVGNSWDFPTFAGLFWLAALAGPLSIAGYRLPPHGLAPGGHRGIIRALITHHPWLVTVLRRLVLISVCSVLLYSPFFLGFASQVKGIGFSADRTPLPSMLIIFGPFFFALAAFLAWYARPGSLSPGKAGTRIPHLLWGCGLVLVLSSAVAGSIALLLGLLSLSGAALQRTLFSPGPPAEPSSSAFPAKGAMVFLLIATTLGLVLIIGPEFVFLADSFGTRMNTVFKFHYQAWLLLALASSVGVALSVAAMRSLLARGLLAIGVSLLVGVGLLYPLAATPAKAHQFQPRPNLDGAAFYQAIRPEDYAAIQWLARTSSGRPVVLEATGGQYSEYGRVSVFSGLPTVLGWAGHELQWRGRGEEPQRRAQDIDTIYRTGDGAAIMALLRQYRVRYVFVGSLEMERYGQAVADRFEGLLELAHRQGRVVIYRVP